MRVRVSIRVGVRVRIRISSFSTFVFTATLQEVNQLSKLFQVQISLQRKAKGALNSEALVDLVATLGFKLRTGLTRTTRATMPHVGGVRVVGSVILVMRVSVIDVPIEYRRQ